MSRGFSYSGRAIARRQGYGGLPVIEMDHPLAAPERDALHPKADAIVEEVVFALTRNAEKKFRGPVNLCPK